MHKRILVPLDGSVFSEAVLPHARDLAIALDAEIILLHVIVEPVPEFDPISSPLSPPILIEKSVDETKVYLKTLCYQMEQDGIQATYLIRDGAVADTILEVSATMQADMIAMSTHGRSGLLQLLFGSVTERVVHRSPILVALIRPQVE